MPFQGPDKRGLGIQYDETTVERNTILSNENFTHKPLVSRAELIMDPTNKSQFLPLGEDASNKAKWIAANATTVARWITWRDGREEGFQAHRVVHLEAVLVQERGFEGAETCTHCQKGDGPFTQCVVMSSAFKECAACHYSGDPKRCSFRPTEAPAPRKRGREVKMTRKQQVAAAERMTDDDIAAELLELNEGISVLLEAQRNKRKRQEDDVRGGSPELG